MKKIIFILLFTPLLMHSQTWYPIGATWYYNYQEYVMFPAHGYVKYTVVSDTLVDTIPSKIIKKEIIKYTGDTVSISSLIVSEVNSKVYYYHNNAFQLMYDFTLNVGDTLDIDISSSSCDSVTPLIVDSIGIININGSNLNVQYVSGAYFYISPWEAQSQTKTYQIIEKIGIDQMCFMCPNFLFNPVCTIEEGFIWIGLRCYNDSAISYTGHDWGSHFPGVPCDTLIDGSTGISINSINKYNVEVFPNPATQDMQISLSENLLLNNLTIEIFDIQGRNVKQYQNLGSYQLTLYRTDFKTAGIYFVKVKNNNYSETI